MTTNPASGSSITEGYTAENLPWLKLHVENQGDKFRPLSTTLLSIFDEADQQAEDRLTSYLPSAGEADEIEEEETERLLVAVLEAIAAYEQAPASKYHQYHIDELRAKLVPWDDED